MGRSIDLLTNALHLNAGSVAALLPGLLDGILPAELLPVFLHEVAHHWCLSTIVGGALATLEVEAQRLGNEARIRELRETQVTLEPFLEGLALFAEFDAFPGPATVMSPVLLWTEALFQPAKSERSLDAVERVRRLAEALRTTEVMIRRKSNVLVKPATIHNGGYLVGYLAVKNLWQMSVSRAPRLRDTELFFAYLRNLVLEDPELAFRILNGGALVEQIESRLNLLTAPDLDQRVLRFEQLLERGRWMDSLGEPVFIEEDARRRFDEEFAKRWVTLLEGRDIHQAFVDVAPLAHRKLIRLHVEQVDVRALPGRRCEVSTRGMKLLRSPLLPKAKQGTGRGTLAAYFLPDEGALCLIGTRKGQPAWAWFPATISETTRESVFVSVAQVLLSEHGREGMRSVLAGVGETGSFQSVEELYARLAFEVVPEILRPRVRHAMERNGFWDLLDEDGDSVRGLAALGLAGSVTANAEELVRLAGISSKDLQPLLEKLEYAEPRGFAVVHRDPLRCLV